MPYNGGQNRFVNKNSPGGSRDRTPPPTGAKLKSFYLPEITVSNSRIGGDTLWMWIQNLATIVTAPAVMADLKELTGRLSIAYFLNLTAPQRAMNK